MSNLQVGDVIFSSGNSWISKVIKWFQDSEWSHVEVVVAVLDDFYMTASSEILGMEIKVRKYDSSSKKAYCHIPNLVVEDGIDYLLGLCQQNVRYDYEGLIGYAFSRIFQWSKNKWQNPKAVFCSEVTAEYLKISGFSEILSIPSSQISPKKLWFYLHNYKIN